MPETAEERFQPAIKLWAGVKGAFARLPHWRCSHAMRPLRYSINVTLDGCCDHREMIPDEDLHRHAVENLVQADALLLGRVTYEMMEAARRRDPPLPPRPAPPVRPAAEVSVSASSPRAAVLLLPRI